MARTELATQTNTKPVLKDFENSLQKNKTPKT